MGPDKKFLARFGASSVCSTKRMAKIADLLRFAAVLSLLAGSRNEAFAAEPNREDAKRMTDLGAQAMDRGDFVEALEDFREANSIFPSPNLRYDMGLALDKLGRAAEAVEAFEEFLANREHGTPEARVFARTRLTELEVTVARLEIVVTPPDATLTIDDRPVELRGGSGVPVPVGERTLRVQKAAYAPATERVVVAAGEHRRVEINLKPIASVSAAVAPAVRVVAAPVAQAPPAHRSRGKRLAALLLGGVGLAAVGGGISAGVVAQRASDQLTENDGKGLPFDESQQRRGKAAATAEGALFAVGAAALATGLVLYLVDGRQARGASRR
jgi:hypothetical protein